MQRRAREGSSEDEDDGLSVSYAPDAARAAFLDKHVVRARKVGQLVCVRA